MITLRKYGLLGSDALRPDLARELHGELIDAQVEKLAQLRREFETRSESIRDDAGLNDVGKSAAFTSLRAETTTRLRAEYRARRAGLDRDLAAAEQRVLRPLLRPEFTDAALRVAFEVRAREVREDLRELATRNGRTAVDGMFVNGTEARLYQAAARGDLELVQAVATGPSTFDVVRPEVVEHAYEACVRARNPVVTTRIDATRAALRLYRYNAASTAREMDVLLDERPQTPRAKKEAT